MSKKNTSIILDKKRVVKFTLKSIRRLHKEHGLNILNKTQVLKLDEELDSDKLVLLLWAGLVHEEQDLTVEKVFDLIGDIDISELQNIIGNTLSGDL